MAGYNFVQVWVVSKKELPRHRLLVCAAAPVHKPKLSLLSRQFCILAKKVNG